MAADPRPYAPRFFPSNEQARAGGSGADGANLREYYLDIPGNTRSFAYYRIVLTAPTATRENEGYGGVVITDTSKDAIQLSMIMLTVAK